MRTTSVLDVGDDLEITKVKKRESAHGTWVDGTLAGHRFNALVFPEHAEVSDYEIGDSRISKLWVQRLADKQIAFHWDRGADIEARDETASAIVGFLCAGLADYIFPE